MRLNNRNIITSSPNNMSNLRQEADKDTAIICLPLHCIHALISALYSAFSSNKPYRGGRGLMGLIFLLS